MGRQGSRNGAVFTQGSTMRHVIIMTSTAAIGMMALFFVDIITLFYISQLNDPAQTAAVGRAGYVIGFLIAISVGMMIGASVLIARSIGQGREDDARRYAGSALAGAAMVGTVFAAVSLVLISWFMDMLGAEGAALAHARRYLLIILPAMPFVSVGMISIGILRAWGAARESMYITLAGGILTAALDPIFIFVLGLEVTGAAIVTLIARISFAAYGLYLVLVAADMARFADFRKIGLDIWEMAKVGGPAIMTNLAAPIGAFIIAQKIAEYGDMALAGQAVVDRLIPLTFGVIFALSGAVGPIIGQNFGAGLMDRTRQTLIDGIIFNITYVLLAWAVLYLARNAIISAFMATGDMALMIDLFCRIAAAAFLFNGILFVTNAAFNNLGKPLWATGFNWSRQTIGVLPFITIGAMWGDLTGIAYGIVAGSIPFALIAVIFAFRLIRSHDNRIKTGATA